ncbi:MAG: hypothetical protein ACLR8P_09425 [Clostridium fessum]
MSGWAPDYFLDSVQQLPMEAPGAAPPATNCSNTTVMNTMSTSAQPETTSGKER